MSQVILWYNGSYYKRKTAGYNERPCNLCVANTTTLCDILAMGCDPENDSSQTPIWCDTTKYSHDLYFVKD